MIDTNIPVGIDFADNDFHNTMRYFMAALQQHYHIDNLPPKHETLEDMRKHIVRLFNDTIFSFYLMHQNKYRYGNPDDSNHLKNYLVIEEKHVYLDEEAMKHYCDGPHNSEFYYYVSPYGDINWC